MRHHHALKIHSSHHLYTLCIIGFIFTLQASLPTYINSSFLSTFMPEDVVSALYIISSAGTVIAFLFYHHVLNKLGNYKSTIMLTIIQAVLLGCLIYGKDIFLVGPAFVLSLIMVSILGISIDIFLEDSTNSTETGGVRGIFLTAVNAAWVIAPLLIGMLIDGGENYRLIYGAALVLIVPFAYLIKKNFRNFVDPHYSHATVKATAHKVFHSRDLKKIFTANLILQSFYAWMVIYTPIYLNKYIGFNWEQIGMIFTVMLLPFILVDYPLGKLADKKYGEAEIMSIGFLILGVSTIALAYIDGPHIFMWMTVLFLTRIGAATVEMMIETYFFKKVPEKDLNVLEFFRITRPTAYIITPIIATVALSTLGHQMMFVVVGTLCLCGLYFSLTIHDTN